MRGTVDVVTSPCADEMTGVLPTSTSALTTAGNSRSSLPEVPDIGRGVVGAACE